MAVDPSTLINGTVADANQVEAKFDVLFSDVDETNVDQTAIMVLTNVAQNMSGVKTIISGGRIDCAAIADALRISSSAPTLDRSIGFLQKTLQYYDSASMKNFLTAHLGVGGWVWNGRLVNDTTNKRVKLVGDDGNDPSPTNPVWVCVPSTTAGKWFVGKITAAKGFDYQGATDSDIIGEEFGVTTGVAWGNDRPFAGYIVNQNDTDAGLEIAISPNPAAKESPATTNIGYLDVPATTPSDNNFFFWTATNVTATHNAKPCFRFCSFRMTMNASDDWAATAFDNGDGIDYLRSYNFGTRVYTFPEGQMGNASSNLVSGNGGVPPAWTTKEGTYYLRESGLCTYNVYLTGDGGTDGSGTQKLRVGLPYKYPGTRDSYKAMVQISNSLTTNQLPAAMSVINNSSLAKLVYNTSATNVFEYECGSFGAGARTIDGSISYQCF